MAESNNRGWRNVISDALGLTAGAAVPSGSVAARKAAMGGPKWMWGDGKGAKGVGKKIVSRGGPAIAAGLGSAYILGDTFSDLRKGGFWGADNVIYRNTLGRIDGTNEAIAHAKEMERKAAEREAQLAQRQTQELFQSVGVPSQDVLSQLGPRPQASSNFANALANAQVDRSGLNSIDQTLSRVLAEYARQQKYVEEMGVSLKDYIGRIESELPGTLAKIAQAYGDSVAPINQQLASAGEADPEIAAANQARLENLRAQGLDTAPYEQQAASAAVARQAVAGANEQYALGNQSALRQFGASEGQLSAQMMAAARTELAMNQARMINDLLKQRAGAEADFGLRRGELEAQLNNQQMQFGLEAAREQDAVAGRQYDMDRDWRDEQRLERGSQQADRLRQIGEIARSEVAKLPSVNGQRIARQALDAVLDGGYGDAAAMIKIAVEDGMINAAEAEQILALADAYYIETQKLSEVS
jgi:hypothetical protein